MSLNAALVALYRDVTALPPRTLEKMFCTVEEASLYGRGFQHGANGATTAWIVSNGKVLELSDSGYLQETQTCKFSFPGMPDGTRLFMNDARSILFVFNGNADILDMVLPTDFRAGYESSRLLATQPCMAAAWVVAAAECVGENVLHGFNSDQEKIVTDTVLRDPALIRSVLNASPVLLQDAFDEPWFAGKLVIALGMDPLVPDLIPVAARDAATAAQVVRERPDIRDRRLVLAAAGIGNNLRKGAVQEAAAIERD